MRVVLLSWGSAGDVVPFVALASALRRRGHHPVFALPRHLAPFAERHGFACAPIGPDLSDFYHEMQVLITEGRFTMAHVAERTRILKEIAPGAIQTLRALCADADALVSLYAMPFVDVVQRITRIPVAVLRVAYPGYEDPTRVPREGEAIRATLPGGLAPQLLLYALSRTIVPPDPGWPRHHHVTGFFFLDEAEFTPPPELRAFLDGGPAPIVITMGGQAHADPAALTALFLEAVARAGCRAIIQGGWSGLARDAALPSSVYAAGYIPHAWLFPRAACVVHHGSAGTTAAGLRAGAPAVIIAHGPEQRAFAEAVRSLGCAGGVIPYRQLGAGLLAGVLTQTLGSQQLRQTAAAVSAVVQQERGAEAACDLIETLERRQARQPHDGDDGAARSSIA